MSRYSDVFATHSYHALFKNITKLVDEMDVGDISQPANTSEILRLKKVIAYLNEILSSLDPELAPLNIWDAFYQHSQNAYNEVANYISNRNIGHIVNANSYVDNLLNLVRPYLLLKGRAKSVSENVFANSQKNLEELVGSFQSLANQKLAIIDETLKSSQIQSNLIDELKQSIEDFNTKIVGTADAPGYSELIIGTYKDISIKYDEVVNLHNELLVDTSTEHSIKTIITESKDEALRDKALIAKAKVEVSSTIEELKAFSLKIFGKLVNQNQRVGGLAQEISERMDFLDKLEKSSTTRYKAIIDNIESLVPAATSAGLAKAYQDMKNSFDKPIEWSSYLFYISVGLLIIFSYFSAISFELTKTANGFHYTYGVMRYASIEEALRLNFFKIPLWGALVWVAVFASKRRSEFQRLQQEYAHKEAFASSYISYKQQIEALASKDTKLQDELIQKMIEAIAFNASQTLDGNHGDKHPLQSIFEKCSDKLEDKISLSELLAIFKKK